MINYTKKTASKAPNKSKKSLLYPFMHEETVEVRIKNKHKKKTKNQNLMLIVKIINSLNDHRYESQALWMSHFQTKFKHVCQFRWDYSKAQIREDKTNQRNTN